MAYAYFCTAEDCWAQSLTRLSQRWHSWTTNVDIASPGDCTVTFIAQGERSFTECSSCNLRSVLPSCTFFLHEPPTAYRLWTGYEDDFSKWHHFAGRCNATALST